MIHLVHIGLQREWEEKPVGQSKTTKDEVVYLWVHLLHVQMESAPKIKHWQQ
jgi:hypothetical protein